MTEKLFTGTLNHNKNKNKTKHFVLQTFNKLTLDTSLKFYMFSLSAMKSRRNGTEVESE